MLAAYVAMVLVTELRPLHRLTVGWASLLSLDSAGGKPLTNIDAGKRLMKNTSVGKDYWWGQGEGRWGGVQSRMPNPLSPDRCSVRPSFCELHGCRESWLDFQGIFSYLGLSNNVCICGLRRRKTQRWSALLQEKERVNSTSALSLDQLISKEKNFEKSEVKVHSNNAVMLRCGVEWAWHRDNLWPRLTARQERGRKVAAVLIHHHGSEPTRQQKAG